MGQVCTCSRTLYKEVGIDMPPYHRDIIPGQSQHFGFYISQQMIERRKDLIIKMRVEKGRFVRMVVGRDESFPHQTRRMWEQSRYCLCKSPECDHNYPHCMNMSGGICSDCIHHDESWKRLSHDIKLGGLALDPQENQIEVGVDGREYIRDQTGYAFTIRMEIKDSDVKVGHYFVTLEAAPKIEQDLLKKHKSQGVGYQRNGAEGSGMPNGSTLDEDEDELMDPPVYSYWIKVEEREPRGPPKRGNDEHIRDIADERDGEWQHSAEGQPPRRARFASFTEKEESEYRADRKQYIRDEEERRQFDRERELQLAYNPNSSVNPPAFTL